MLIFIYNVVDRKLVKVIDASAENYSAGARDALKANGEAMLNRWDFKTFADADKMAAEATTLTGRLHIGTDSGEHVSPRYDVIEAPTVGQEVSCYFNGDAYPAGKIVSISKTLKKVVTDDGTTFFRRRNSGAWVNHGTWAMVEGRRSERNPSF